MLSESACHCNCAYVLELYPDPATALGGLRGSEGVRPGCLITPCDHCRCDVRSVEKSDEWGLSSSVSYPSCKCCFLSAAAAYPAVEAVNSFRVLIWQLLCFTI